MLTARQVETAKSRAKPYNLTDTAGLYLHVRVSGTKVWRYNYREAAVQKTKTYGNYPSITLADARATHAVWLGAGKALTEKPIPTFKEVAAQWLKIHLTTLSNLKHQKQVVMTLEEYVYPRLGDKPVDTIKRADMVETVRAVMQPGEGDPRTETAHRVAGRIAMVMNYAQDAGLIESHAAQGLTRVLPSKNVKHMPAIASTQASILLQKIDAYPSVTTRLLLLMLANTFVRVGELVGMRWDEIRGDVWVIPASRMKRRIPHVVPLSTQVKAILAKLRLLNEGSDLVFESPLNRGQSISKETPINALYRMGLKGEMTAHGFRSLASSVLNERSEFKKEVIERQLAHSETDEVHAAYNRAEYLDQRIKLMQWWSDWLDGQRVAATHVVGSSQVT